MLAIKEIILSRCCLGCTDHSGNEREDGESWTCADGCNRCWCIGGLVASTRKGCIKPKNPGNSSQKLSCHNPHA